MPFCATCGAPVEGRFCAKCGGAVAGGSASTIRQGEGEAKRERRENPRTPAGKNGEEIGNRPLDWRIAGQPAG